MRRFVPLLLALALIWGASFLFIKVGLRDFSPIVLAWGRLVIGAALPAVVLPAAGGAGGGGAARRGGTGAGGGAWGLGGGAHRRHRGAPPRARAERRAVRAHPLGRD